MNACPWIYFNGSPGVGKLTIAKQLRDLIPGSKVIHNHLVIELCLGAFERGSQEYEDLRKAVRNEVLSAISTSEKGRETTYIFTGSHGADTSVGPMIARQHSDHAKAQNIPFISVIMTCEEEEHLRRVTSADRKFKLNDIDSLKKTVSSGELFAFQCEYEINPLDVTNLSPLEGAKVIYDFIQECMTKEKLKSTHTTS
ncbi:hypothetical protein Clacol_006889 [Clathrus columnatus]|uniref:Uncharacterized protein n=1 Tax=Clathrus columnatus TaxID=1419009 RepID=A0AAV5AEE3_9AGAM|nr:hypothetical protein Clacol_006889 [Clathrus columnatus]